MKTPLNVQYTLNCRAIKGDFFGYACFLEDGRIVIFSDNDTTAIDIFYSHQEADRKYIFLSEAGGNL